MQELMVFTPNLQLKHPHPTTLLQLTEKMPQDDASYLDYAHHLAHVIETPEREGGILW